MNVVRGAASPDLTCTLWRRRAGLHPRHPRPEVGFVLARHRRRDEGHVRYVRQRRQVLREIRRRCDAAHLEHATDVVRQSLGATFRMTCGPALGPALRMTCGPAFRMTLVATLRPAFRSTVRKSLRARFAPQRAHQRAVVRSRPLPCAQPSPDTLQDALRLLRQRPQGQRGVNLRRRPPRKRPALRRLPVAARLAQVDRQPRTAARPVACRNLDQISGNPQRWYTPSLPRRTSVE